MKRILISWADGVPLAYRSALEHAFDRLQIAYADAADIDDAEERFVRLGVIERGQAAPGADLTLVAHGPSPGGLRTLLLTPEDIGTPNTRWLGALTALERLLDRPGLSAFANAGDDEAELSRWALAHVGDPLALDLNTARTPAVLASRLSQERERANEAEAEMRRLKIALADADRERSIARKETQAASDARQKLEDRIARLEWTLEACAFRVSDAPPAMREAVETGRAHAGLARLAAARARDAARMHGEALAWAKSGALYSGQTRNQSPEGAGEMTFKGARAPGYRGEFRDGKRHGHGVGASPEGHVWTGEWRNDVASGFGLLETADGRRFEGQIAATGGANPRVVLGWWWDIEGRSVQPMPQDSPLLIGAD
jgi:hypothetical protein